MNKLLVGVVVFLIVVLFPARVNARTLTVAVLDTGVDRASSDKLCRFGHRSFVKQQPPLTDYNGHGTHIAGIIRREAGDGNYCIVDVKYYSAAHSGMQNIRSLLSALRYAINIKVDFINISGGGPEFVKEEYLLIEKALDQGIKVVVAAGNEGYNLNYSCNYFPACYDPRIVVVGNLRQASVRIPYIGSWSTERFERNPSSNYGNAVSRWEVGTDVQSTLPHGYMGTMSGTSQATAVATGKLVRDRLSQ
jgi:subtilisin family serine protease